MAEHTGHVSSMLWFWMAMARLAGWDWFTPRWWPFWDAGMPFEHTYAPLVPFLTSLSSKITGWSVGRSFHALAGAIYVATPLTLYLASALLTRCPGWSFVCA